MGAAARFIELPWRDRLLLAETVALLGFSRLCVALVRFERVTRLADSKARGRPPATSAQARRIAWAVTACARRVPWRALCFEQGLAAQFLLRRRGLAATLFYGIRPARGDDLTAHVWVRSGEVDIVGCEAAADYGLVGSYGA
jgi:hypothetical protein